MITRETLDDIYKGGLIDAGSYNRLLAQVELHERIAELEKEATAYKELLFAVASKFPGESRHDTALRYIRNAEKGCGRSQAASGGEW